MESSEWLRPELVLVLMLALDEVFGDPEYHWHPVRVLGNFVGKAEALLWNLGWNGESGGLLLLSVTVGISVGASTLLLALGQLGGGLLEMTVLLFLGWSLLALKDLLVHAKRVGIALEEADLPEARQQVSRLVSRDTDQMDLHACGRAAVESVSENLSDGVIAPLFWFAVAGIPGMAAFKAVSTLDSMVGYHSERYRQFGWASARLDDWLCWIPARLTFLLLVVSAAVSGGSGSAAWRVGLQDHRKLPSLNAGWAEATAAGALGIRLCGPIWRKGKLASDFWLGDPGARAEVTNTDLQRMNRLARVATWGFAGVLMIVFVLGWTPVGWHGISDFGLNPARNHQ